MLMQGAGEQILIFLRSVLVGCLLGLVFEAIRFVRIMFSIGENPEKKFDVAEFFCDLLFFFLSAVVASVFIYHRNYGIPRFYIFLGFTAGFSLYYATIGRLAVFAERKVAAVPRRIARAIKQRKAKEKGEKQNEKE